MEEKKETTNVSSPPPVTDCKTPANVADTVEHAFGITKCNASWFNLLILGILAGVYIGFGASIATLVASDSAKYLGLGLSKFFTGAVFSVGLMLVVIAGAELFTGNNLILVSVLGGHAKFSKLLRNWIIVYIANFIGSILLVLIMYGTNLWKAGEPSIGLTAVKIANAKVNLGFGEALLRGILCNWLVCLAVWMALASRNIIGKIFAIFFPIMTFVAMGFEHSIANMYFIPMGLFLKGSVALGELSVFNLTWFAFFVNNLIPVTIGNIIGGAVFVGLVYWSVYQRNQKY